MYLKFFIFKLPNVSNKDALSILKRLLCSAINKRHKKFEHLSKELSLSKKLLSTELSTNDFYTLTKSITSYNKKSPAEIVIHSTKKLSSLTRDCNLPIFTANETVTNLTQYELSQEESDLLKAGLYFQSSQIKFENPKFSLPLKRFTVRFLTTLNPRKPKVR